MNKNLKKIIVATLTISAFSAVIPANDFSLMTTRAYASTNELTSLKLKTSSGSTIKTYSDDDYKKKNEIDDDEINDGDTCYAKTSSSKIKISTSGVNSSYVRVFKGKTSSTKGIKTSSTIELTEGSTQTLTVRTYEEDPGTVRYDDNSYVSEYKIKVKYTKSSSDSDDQENGDIYLKSIYLSDGDINFSKSTSTYNVDVIESVSEIKITAKPDCDSDEYDNYEVRIDGTIVDEDDSFKKSVSLKKGKNEIKITVDNGEKRTYILNITRGEAAAIVKIDQWIQVNGLWQYNDSTGNPIRNNWFNDKNYGGNWYYLGPDGFKKIGWQSVGGTWYYLNSSGVMQTGWVNINGTWYYLNPSSNGTKGAMKTGWVNDNGTWYYLYPNGSMAYSITISGYKLGKSGAWIR